MPEEPIRVDYDLFEGQALWIRTPEGLVSVATYVGTQVTVYTSLDSGGPHSYSWIPREDKQSDG